LVPLGARAATFRIASIVARGTISGKKARIERREVIAASTIEAGPGARRSSSFTLRTPERIAQFAYFWCIAPQG
jgi:hypothetical protein